MIPDGAHQLDSSCLMPDELSVAFWIIAAGWTFLAIRSWAQIRRLRALPAAPAEIGADEASVTVVIAARDEASRIVRTIRAALAQRQVKLEVVLVDDRSVDETGETLRAIMREDSRLHHVRIESLPAGWLGKCHAMHTGAAGAGSEWLLFADADTTLRDPDTLRRVVQTARTEHADHACLLPRMPARTPWAQAMTCALLLLAVDRLDRVQRDQPGCYFGVGAFNLVRSSLYHSFGGHEPLKLEVLDDVHLGALVREHGGRSRFFTAFTEVETTWGGTVRELVQVLEKNGFAALRYSAALVVVYVGLFLLGWGGALLGPAFSVATRGVAPSAAFLAMMLLIAPAMNVAHRLGFPRAVAALALLSLPILIYAGLRSTALTLGRGGVRWRDTFYPLAELRAGRFRSRGGR